MSAKVGAVVIGRNEGERLVRCLESLAVLRPWIVYVDSGSTDGSVEAARSLGADVICLDPQLGFTAARARNAGLRRLLQIAPQIELVQFLDGDCQLVTGWLEAAIEAFAQDDRWVVVCGRRRERAPDRSPYNRLCDMEWNTPVGEARACGGDALMRVEGFLRAGGYNERVIAGEEPELCVRLRQQGGRILRLNREMTLHDAAMTHWRQWAKRSQRAGHAYAEAVAMHGRPPERHGVRQSRSIWLWAAFWPAVTALATLQVGPAGLLLLLAYPLLVGKIAVSRRRQFADPWRHCLLYAVSCVLGKGPQLIGQLRYLRSRLLGDPTRIIEYKGQPGPTSQRV